MDAYVNEFARGVFTPEDMAALTAAFDAAWEKVESSNAPWSQPDYAEIARTIIAKHIIRAARDGQMDPKALTEGALLHLSQQRLSRTALLSGE